MQSLYSGSKSGWCSAICFSRSLLSSTSEERYGHGNLEINVQSGSVQSGSVMNWCHPLKGPLSKEKFSSARKKCFSLLMRLDVALPTPWFKALLPLPQFLWIRVSVISSLHQSPIRIKTSRCLKPCFQHRPFRLWRTRKSSVPWRIQMVCDKSYGC